MAALGSLVGFTIGITADRRAHEQAVLLERRGARVVHGPTISTLPLCDEPAIERATRDVLTAPPDVVVLTTGVGVRGWFAAAASLGLDGALLEALSGATVLARGAKAAGAAATIGLYASWRAPTERSADVIEHLGNVAGRRIAVQRDGANDAPLADALRAQGADVVDAAIYRWEVPEDTGPATRLVELVCDGAIDAVTFTSAPAVSNLFAIARSADRHVDLHRAFTDGGVRGVCVGPVCAERAIVEGIAEPVAPERGRLGAMVKMAEDVFAGRARHATIAGSSVTVQGGAVVVAGDDAALSERERALLEALLDAGGSVVAKADLVQRVWAGSADEHVVEVTIGRLRARLGDAGRGIVTVPRRGYRLEHGIVVRGVRRTEVRVGEADEQPAADDVAGHGPHQVAAELAPRR
jgi:uroporphyrinogen-III synthase